MVDTLGRYSYIAATETRSTMAGGPHGFRYSRIIVPTCAGPLGNHPAVRRCRPATAVIRRLPTVPPGTAFRLTVNMIIVSEPSAETTQLVQTGRYATTRRCSSAARHDTARYGDARPISVHTEVIMDGVRSRRMKIGRAVALREVGAGKIGNLGWLDGHDQLVEGSQDP